MLCVHHLVQCAEATSEAAQCDRSPLRILGGKPSVRDTRLHVEFLLELAARGATEDQILARYPQLTPAGLGAAFRYAADALKGEHVWELKTTS